MKPYPTFEEIETEIGKRYPRGETVGLPDIIRIACDLDRKRREVGPGTVGPWTDLDELHPNTVDLVDRFAAALKEKFLAAQMKYGYTDGWLDPNWMDECRTHLLQHIAKGDPRDVANYCAFLWHHGERTS